MDTGEICSPFPLCHLSSFLWIADVSCPLIILGVHKIAFFPVQMLANSAPSLRRISVTTCAIVLHFPGKRGSVT